MPNRYLRLLLAAHGCLASAMFLAPMVLFAQSSPAAVEVMIVGVYHMDNPSQLPHLRKPLQLSQPGDRIVVFFGSGHAFLLRQCVNETPGFKLVESNGYL